MRNTNIVATFLVLQKENKILLSKRHNTGYHDGDWSLVAGHVDEGEPFSQAIIREVKEEIGIMLQPNNLQPAHIMHRKSDSDGSERVDVYFVATSWSGKITNKEPDKCSELKWFDMADLPENMIASVRYALDAVAKGEMYSEYGWK
ncbi:NUDIX domain-containing protein [Candidatus Woesebacteria bacterium]|nr:NUDIX domain-containing protein [Candidatus Woesebacteria bacterium]